jgi:hypothetical protein
MNLAQATKAKAPVVRPAEAFYQPLATGGLKMNESNYTSITHVDEYTTKASIGDDGTVYITQSCLNGGESVVIVPNELFEMLIAMSAIKRSRSAD